jgi:hypothetical protein
LVSVKGEVYSEFGSETLPEASSWEGFLFYGLGKKAGMDSGGIGKRKF